MSIHKDPRWLKALSLTERLKTSKMPTEADLSDKLEKRVKRWREPTGLTDEQRFQKKLDLCGLNEKIFFALLDESDEALRARFEGEPEWLSDLIGLIEGAHAHRFPTDCLDGESRKGFFALVQPLADHAWSCFLGNVRDILGESESQTEIERLCGLFTPAFAMKTMRNLTRTLILELQVRGLQGDLPGETPEVRFKNFVKMLEDNQTRLEIFCQYPLLGRQLLTVFDFWVTVNTEYIRRLHEDQELIHQHYGEGYTLAQLSEIQPDKGDHHRKGRAVIIALFENGHRLVYKPRDMGTDRCFQDLLDWLNQTGFEPAFKTLVTLDRDGYGWMEYTAVAPCENRDQVKRYYLRQGANLALLHTLAGTDFHHENILACGEYPMLIDLETLFQSHHEHHEGATRFEPAVYTPIRVGMLPVAITRDGPDMGMDVTGLGATTSQTTPTLKLVDTGSDRMRFAKSTIQLSAGTHQPVLDGAFCPAADYRDEILEGFRLMYEHLLDQKDALLAEDGPIEAFAGASIRFILRGTTIYHYIQQKTWHPDLLQNALERDRVFDFLWRSVPVYPWLEQVLPFEMEEMLRGDIPRFVSQTDESWLASESGMILDDFFPISGMDLVKNRIRSMGSEDLTRHLWIVESSLLTLLSPDQIYHMEPYQLPAHNGIEKELLLEGAETMARRLMSLAICNGDLVAWYHFSPGAGGGVNLMPSQLDLYNGLSGMLMFFSALEKVTTSSEYRVWTDRCAATMTLYIKNDWIRPNGVGGFSGWGGVIYALACCSRLRGDEKLLDLAETLVPKLADEIENDTVFDVIGGSAGAILALLTLYQMRSSEETLDVAVACADHLLRNTTEVSDGIAWAAPTENDDPPLTGFSHGVAGCALALMALGKVAGEERFTDAAGKALAYERANFDAASHNWRDMRHDRRENDGAYGHQAAWCHGAPGIGMSRVAMMDLLADPLFEEEIEHALIATEISGFGYSHCLCHGDLGNIDLYLLAGDRLSKPELIKKAQQIAMGVALDIKAHGPRTSGSKQTEHLGLMSGIAGLGYGMLRAACPDQIPSLLTFQTGVSITNREKPVVCGHGL